MVGATHTWDERIRQRIRDLMAKVEADPGLIDEQRRRHDAANGDDHWRVLLATLLAWADDPDVLPYQAADLAAIDRPTLVLHGDRDPFYPIEIATALYQAIPEAELAVVPWAGHNPMR